MKKTLIIVCALVIGAVLGQPANAQEKTLRAVVQVDSYGRKVDLRVNEKEGKSTATFVLGGNSVSQAQQE